VNLASREALTTRHNEEIQSLNPLAHQQPIPALLMSVHEGASWRAVADKRLAPLSVTQPTRVVIVCPGSPCA